MAELTRTDRVVAHAVGLTQFAMNNGVFSNVDMAVEGFERFALAVSDVYRTEDSTDAQEADSNAEAERGEEDDEPEEKPKRQRRTRRTERDEEDEAPARREKRESKTGGRKSSKDISLDDAEAMVLNFGAFEGVSLGDLVDIDVDEAERDFHYGDGERDGADYLAGYLAGPKNHNKHVRDRARIVADDRGLEYDAD